MRSENLTIILPGKIGDIIICLPIAKYYHQQGYNVHWPVYDHLITNFVRGHIDYVNFVPIRTSNPIVDSHKYANSIGSKVLDLSFNSPGSWNNNNTKKFLNQREFTFDEFRYKLARVPIEEKWNLDIKRNVEREEDLYSKLVQNPNYVVFQNQASDTNTNYKLDLQKRDLQVVLVQPISDCVFDWCKIMENATKLVLIESCFSNLVDQLKIDTEKFLIMKPGYYREKLDGRDLHLGTPILKGDWQIIQ